MARSDELEMKLKRWYDRVPHLSSYSREWLSNNIWWMALIGVVFNAVGLYRVVNVLLAVFGMERPGVDIQPVLDVASYNWVFVAISALQFAVTLMFMVFAVSPLRERAKQGWVLLYWSFVVNFTLGFMAMIASFRLFNAVVVVAQAGIAGYFLFEIRSYFALHRESKLLKHAKHLVKKRKK
jgi:phosphoglycerol transferase MdoB-like AlkP superfamily enzyme